MGPGPSTQQVHHTLWTAAAGWLPAGVGACTRAAKSTPCYLLPVGSAASHRWAGTATHMATCTGCTGMHSMGMHHADVRAGWS